MTRRLTIRQRIAGRKLLEDKSGSTLVEWMLILPVLFLIVAYAVNFGFCFIAAANITSSARNAAQYSVLGYEGPAQSAEPVAGPVSTTNSVAAIAMADLTSLVQSSTTTTVQVCSKIIGMSTANANIPKCSSYGPAGTSYTPIADPEAPRFVLQRVDVTYTVQPPIPMSFFGVSLMPHLNFHRQVSMRSMD
jgi:Flp pilus assembly protein TadG